MDAMLSVLLTLFLLLVVDAARWSFFVKRELKRRKLMRVRDRNVERIIRITPARGYRVIDTCTCERDGKRYDVIILNHGWLRMRPSVKELAEEH